MGIFPLSFSTVELPEKQLLSSEEEESDCWSLSDHGIETRELLSEIIITFALSLTDKSNCSTRLTVGLNTKFVYTSLKKKIYGTLRFCPRKYFGDPP